MKSSQVPLFLFFVGFVALAKSQSWCDQWRHTFDDAEKRFHFHHRNVSRYNTFGRPRDPSIQGVVTYKHADEEGGSWFGSMYGVPMLLARLSEKRLQPLAVWLRKQVPRWRKLGRYHNWDAGTAKYTSYNALEEALNCDAKDVRRAAEYFELEIKRRFVEINEYYDQLPKLKSQECPGGHQWQPRIMPVDEHLLGKTPAGVRIQSWVNAQNAGDPNNNHIPPHDHDVPWHGYILFDADLTNTTYHAPPPIDGVPRPLFNLVNEDFVLVLQNGGIDHLVPPPPLKFAKPQRPRLSLAFDLVFSLEHHGHVVGHPGARFQSQPLKMMELESRPPNEGKKTTGKWSVLMSPDEKHTFFHGHSPATFDHTAWHTGPRSESTLTLWAGIVDMHILLPDLKNEGNRRQRLYRRKGGEF